jgi:hypothetical protein
MISVEILAIIVFILFLLQITTLLILFKRKNKKESTISLSRRKQYGSPRKKL